MIRLVLIILIFIGIVTGIICLGVNDYTQNKSQQKARQSCGGRCEGADNMQDFVKNDCANCPCWRGKC